MKKLLLIGLLLTQSFSVFSSDDNGFTADDESISDDNNTDNDRYALDNDRNLSFSKFVKDILSAAEKDFNPYPPKDTIRNTASARVASIVAKHDDSSKRKRKQHRDQETDKKSNEEGDDFHAKRNQSNTTITQKIGVNTSIHKKYERPFYDQSFQDSYFSSDVKSDNKKEALCKICNTTYKDYADYLSHTRQKHMILKPNKVIENNCESSKNYKEDDTVNKESDDFHAKHNQDNALEKDEHSTEENNKESNGIISATQEDFNSFFPTGITSASTALTPTKSKEKKRTEYKCNLCKLKFTKEWNRNRHKKRIHNNDLKSKRFYACFLCKTSWFTHKTKLNKHIKDYCANSNFQPDNDSDQDNSDTSSQNHEEDDDDFVAIEEIIKENPGAFGITITEFGITMTEEAIADTNSILNVTKHKKSSESNEQINEKDDVTDDHHTVKRKKF